MNFFRKPNAARPAVFGLFLLLASPAAFAVDVFGAIDVFGIVDQIKNQEISIFLIGGACLLVAVVISSFQCLNEVIEDKKQYKKQLRRQIQREKVAQQRTLSRIRRELNHSDTSIARKMQLHDQLKRVKRGF